MKSVRSLLAAAMLLPAIAGAQTLNGGWTAFTWSGAATQLGVRSFSITSANPFSVQLTDAGRVGDQFRLNWTGAANGNAFTSVFG